MLSPLDDYVGRSAFYVGDLDRKITWICERLVGPGDTVLDVGANLGLVTVLLGSLVGKQGNVLSFEPNPRIREMLEATIIRNELENVTVYACALGGTSESLDLWVPPHNAGEGSLVRHHRSDESSTHRVQVRRLSDILSEQPLSKIRLMKIDVEGFEEDVLSGASELLSSANRPDAILFELNEIQGPISDQPVIKRLRSHGYGFFSIPRCLMRMQLQRFEPGSATPQNCNDFLAVPLGATYEEVATILRAGSEQAKSRPETTAGQN